LRIIKPSTVRRYAAKYPTAKPGLSAWLLVTMKAEWQSIREVRQVFPHADALTVASGNVVTVFNMAGNHFRLIVAIHYNTQRVYIRDFMTHAEYSKDAWKGRH
jgi:mRNA interferase HigB